MDLTALGTSYKWNHTVLSFYDWLISLAIMSSRFNHIVAGVRISFFLRLNNIPLCGYTTFCLSSHLSMDVWVVSTFCLLWMLLRWEQVCKHPFKSLLSLLVEGVLSGSQNVRPEERECTDLGAPSWDTGFNILARTQRMTGQLGCWIGS